MPELPEVEVMRRYFDASALNKKISSIELYDKKILRGNLNQLSKKLNRDSFSESSRIGKYVFLKTKKGMEWVLHFGMTGDLEFVADESLKPRFSRMAFRFVKNEFLHVLSVRKFGYVASIESKESFVNQKKLGPDALGLLQSEFVRIVSGSRAMIKPFLMAQKNVAGIGNWIADELLHREQVHPKESISNLSDKRLGKMSVSLQKILKVAIKRGTNYSNFPRKWFANQRHLDGFCTRCEKAVGKLEVGGRSSYFCARCQKL